MVVKYKYLILLSLLVLLNQAVIAQNYCLKYGVVNNGTTVDITLSLVASGNTFRLGACNLQFKYKTAALANPTFINSALTVTGRYNGMSLTQPTPLNFIGTGDALVSFNFNFTGALGTGLLISNTDIVVIRFQVVNANVSPNLRPYDNGSAGTIVYNDDPNSPLLLSTTGNCPIYNFALPAVSRPLAYGALGSEQKTTPVNSATVSEKENSSLEDERKENIAKILPSTAVNNSTVLKIYPTLFTTTNSFLNIEWTSDKGGGLPDFQIVTLLGQQVRMGKLATRIDVSDLPQGAYIFKVGLEQAKFVKQ